MKNFLLRSMTMVSTRMKYLLLVSFWLISINKSAVSQQLLCGQSDSIKITVCNGFLPIVTYPPSVFYDGLFSLLGEATIVRTEGLASGSAFPYGTTRVTHVATWYCDPIFQPGVTCTDVCTFTVTVTPVAGVTFYRDWDLDGWGDTANPDHFVGCPEGYYPSYSYLPGDCNDTDPSTYRTAFIYKDNDGDGYTIALGSICWGDVWPDNVPQPGVDPGYVSTSLGEDCDDFDPTITQQKFYYHDHDNDGYRGWGSRVVGNEVGYWSCRRYETDKLESELRGMEIDCDDNDPLEYPGRFWILDNDLDRHGADVIGGGQGLVLGGCTRPEGNWFDPSELISVHDCNDGDPLEHPDQNWFLDNDGDHHGGGQPIISCTRPAGNWFAPSELISVSDCDDNNRYINPGATEFCNGIDDNCDGLIDQPYCCPTSGIIYVNAANTGTQNGNSWATAFKYLQDALEVARLCNTATQIWVAGGSYYPDEGGTAIDQHNGFYFQPRGGLAIYGGFLGTETLLSQRTLSAPPSILSGEIQQDASPYYNSTNILVLDNINTPFVLDGFTIQDAYSIRISETTARGVGLLVLNSTSAVRITNCTFRNNFGNLGTIGNVNSNPLFINCVVTGNTTNFGNGVIWNDNSSPYFLNCTIADNVIPDGDLIVIRNTGSSSPSIINSIVRGTSPAMDGGTPFVDHSYVQNASVWPGEGNINSDPLFIDEANGNLRLQPGSPAINAGWNAINPEQTDIEGKPRKIYLIDMGAYEEQGLPVLCSPISLTNSVLQGLQLSGCGTGDIGSTTFPYSATPAALTSSEYTSLNLPVTDGSCDIATVNYTDAIDQALSLPGKVVVVRTFTIRDVNGAAVTATQHIEVVEATAAPTVLTKNITVQLTVGGSVRITPAQINNGSFAACGILTFSLSRSTFVCSNVGANTVTLTATDAKGNTASANATVTVEDRVAPIMVIKNLTVQLTAGGNVTITPAQVNSGSFDACGIQTFSLSRSTFVCSNVGANTVTLTATDANGNTASANATVTVEDHVAPTMLTKNITVQLTAGGNATITAVQVNNGSFDACSIQAYSLSKSIFYCSDIGANTVKLTAIDANGNTASANATVTVEDHIAPTMLTKNITVQLGTTGIATISHTNIDNGSYDACGIANYIFSKNIFNCSNVGPNTVTLKATDANGNTATATATVTVVDNLPPSVNTRNATIYLNASGQATLTVAQVNNNSTDNCSIPSNGYLLNKTSFDCSNIGLNTVALKATDASGNIATANATVTVVDNLVPIANCKNITVYLGTNGLVNITGTDLNNNSTDNCQSSLSFSVNRTSFNSDDVGSNCEKAFTVVFAAIDGSGNSSTCSATVTVKRRITKLVYNGATQGQYSDPANLSATLYDITDGLPGVAITGKTVTFTLGVQSISDIYGGSGQGTNSSGIANGTLVLNQDPVPAYTIGISFAGDGVYCPSSASTSFDIKPEDLCSQYNGQLSVKANIITKTNNSAKVVMSVGIADATDGNAGDVTKAKVEFNYGNGWITVPAQVLNAAKSMGNATYTATINFSGDGSTLNFNYRITGYYQVDQECSDNGQSVINVYKPQGEFITGGGYIESANRSVGIMPADEGRRANFGFNVKYNQKGTNLQGNISYIFRRKVNDIVRLYQVKGNSMTSLVVNMNDALEGGMKTAVFIGKCNVTDVTNPLAPVTVAGTGNSTMQVIITDATETGVNDKYGITIWTPGNQVFHSSNWEGTKTTKLVLGSGDIVVGGNTSAVLTKTNNTGTESSTPEVDRSATVEKTEASGEDLKVTVMPNPSSTNFRIVVNSYDLKSPVKLLVTDMLGRVIETRISNAGQTITIGDKYISGTYAVRVMQGRKTKQLSLIKLSD